MRTKLLICLFLSFVISSAFGNIRNRSGQNDYSGNERAELNVKLAKGWNTWNNASLLSHVLLPECFSVNLMLKEGLSGDTLKEALVGREEDATKEHVIAGPRSYDGSFTELELEWRNIHVRVQSASQNNELFMLITPIKTSPGDSLLIVPKMLWGRKGNISIDRNKITVQGLVGIKSIYVNGDRWKTGSGNIRVSLGQVFTLSSGFSKSLKDIEKVISLARSSQEKEKPKFSKTPELYNAMHAVLAWNTTYDPINNRVISPVSRNWSGPSGGWVLFDWDTYFAAYMLSLENKDLAYANAIAITKEITKKGFIPNNSQPGHKSEDRTEPQVGALVVREIFRKYQEKWFLQEVFDELLSWNRWRAANRDIDGYLVYGSDPYDYGKSKYRSATESGKMKAAKWESGMDNSPMWDEAVFDSTSHRMLLADVGLMSLYINDCQNLSEIAAVLGKKEIVKELALRATKYSEKLKTLWNEEFGLYLNKDLVTGKFSYRLSPTLFYPLLAKVPDQRQAERMIKEHYFNPREFWGEFIMPTIARNDPAYKDNKYWRGRIWAPVNFLVYLGIRNYDLPGAQKDMVEKSKNLLLKSWMDEKHVYENYNAETGRGDDAGSWSDKFYHWGALLGFIGIMEEGYVPSPQLPLRNGK
jgi:putative isomerase